MYGAFWGLGFKLNSVFSLSLSLSLSLYICIHARTRAHTHTHFFYSFIYIQCYPPSRSSLSFDVEDMS